MKYIKVTNDGTKVNRLSLEKLGLSTKRENEETIGQFGSGVKFAPIAAIRKGMQWAFAGSDNKGDYVLEYIIKDEEGIPCVYYKYEDYEKPSSFTADAGVLSWTNDFQIYREIIANAVDEAKISGNAWSVDVVDVDIIRPVDGEFSVYITATDELLEIHNNFDKYFCVHRNPIAETTFGSLYESIDDVFRVYCKGVLVFSEDKAANDEKRTPFSGLYDYEINTLVLNEERTVSSTWTMHSDIIRIWSSIKDPEIINNIIKCLVNEDLMDTYETTSIPAHQFAYGMSLYNDLWKNEFDNIFPRTVLLSNKECSFNVLKTIHSRNYEHIAIINEGVLNFLILRGLPHAKDIFGEEFKYNYQLGYTEYPKIQEAVEAIYYSNPEVDFYGILGIFDEPDEDANNKATGLSLRIQDNNGNEKDIILIERNHAANADIPSIIGTLIHEWDHYSKLVGDGDMEGRLFRSIADERIGKLIYRIWSDSHSKSAIKKMEV